MTLGRIVLLLAATVLTLLWIVLAVKYTDDYAALTAAIDPEKYRYPELFCIGFAIMNFLHITTKGKSARKRIREISEIQGKKYAEYYYYVINGAKWTYGAGAFFLAGSTGEFRSGPVFWNHSGGNVHVVSGRDPER